MRELELDTVFVMPKAVATRILLSPRLSSRSRKQARAAREIRIHSVGPIVRETVAGKKAYVGYHDHSIVHQTAIAIPSEQKTLAKLKTFSLSKLGTMIKRCCVRRRMLQHAFEKTKLEKLKEQLSIRANRLDTLRDLVVEEIANRTGRKA